MSTSGFFLHPWQSTVIISLYRTHTSFLSFCSIKLQVSVSVYACVCEHTHSHGARIGHRSAVGVILQTLFIFWKPALSALELARFIGQLYHELHGSSCLHFSRAVSLNTVTLCQALGSGFWGMEVGSLCLQEKHLIDWVTRPVLVITSQRIESLQTMTA